MVIGDGTAQNAHQTTQIRPQTITQNKKPSHLFPPTVFLVQDCGKFPYVVMAINLITIVIAALGITHQVTIIFGKFDWVFHCEGRRASGCSRALYL